MCEEEVALGTASQTSTHMRAHARPHTHVHARTLARTHARANERTHARSHAHTRTHTHTNARTHARTHTAHSTPPPRPGLCPRPTKRVPLVNVQAWNLKDPGGESAFDRPLHPRGGGVWGLQPHPIHAV